MALTGALLGSKCFSTQSDALDSYYSVVAPAQTPGSTSYVNEFQKIAGVWNIRGFSVSSTGVWTTLYTTAAPVPTFPACDPTVDFFDGVSLGWGVAAALVAVAAFKLMQKATS